MRVRSAQQPLSCDLAPDTRMASSGPSKAVRSDTQPHSRSLSGQCLEFSLASAVTFTSDSGFRTLIVS